jgi:hypothetical protein
MGAVQKMDLNKLPVVAPSVSRGVSLWDAVPNEVMRDAVPSEARDASLSLGTTE